MDNHMAWKLMPEKNDEFCSVFSGKDDRRYSMMYSPFPLGLLIPPNKYGGVYHKPSHRWGA